MRKGGEFSDLENLLYTGFLFTPVEVPLDKSRLPLRITLKTISTAESDRIHHICGTNTSPLYNYHFNTMFLASAIFSIDYDVVITKRETNFAELVRIVQGWDRHLLHKMLKIVVDLQTRVYLAMEKFDRYAFDDISRYNWSIKKNLVTSNKWFDYPNLGANDLQEMWVKFNQIEDEEVEFTKSWELTKFVCSFINGKAMRQIYARDEARKEEKEEFKKRILEGYNETGFAKPLLTRQDILEELDRQIRGVKDKHDLVVAEYEKKIQESVKERRREVEHVLYTEHEAIHRPEDVPMGISGGSEHVTPEEVRRRVNVPKRMVKPQTVLDGMSDERREKFFQMMEKLDNESQPTPPSNIPTPTPEPVENQYNIRHPTNIENDGMTFSQEEVDINELNRQAQERGWVIHTGKKTRG